jgi:signal transduction histidine kinase
VAIGRWYWRRIDTKVSWTSSPLRRILCGVASSRVLERWPARVAAGAALLLLGVSLTVITGWVTGSAALVQLLPQLPPMTRNAAACFLLCGVALLMQLFAMPRWAIIVCAGFVNLLSVLTIVHNAFGVDLGVNQLLGAPYISVGQKRPGGMAPVTAISFLLASASLLVSPRGFSPRFSFLMGLIGSCIAALGMAGIVGFGGGVALAAFHTVVGLTILGIGMLAVAWHGERHTTPGPRWLPISVGIAATAVTLAFWRALVLGGHAAFDFLPAIVLGGGAVVAPLFGLTVYLAQRGHAQAAALRRSEAFLAEAQYLSRTASFSWRVVTDEITWSEPLSRIFGFEDAVPVTLERIASRVHPDDRPMFRDLVARARREGGDLEYEHRLLMPDDSVKYLNMVARRAPRHDGQLEYIGAMQDVTERRLFEDALGKARSDLAHVSRITSLGALAASIAHEINQPLSGIVTNASTCLRMLAADPPNVAGARETARRTIRDGNRASEIVTRLRALFSKTPVMKESVDLNDAAQEVLALSSSELQRHGVMLRTDLARDLPRVPGDRVQLQQVVLNLLLNAIDALRAVENRPKHIVLRTERDGGESVRLSVEDSGVGFDRQAVDKMFQAFYTTKVAGMGIGLSVSRSIVESHHGRLSAVANDGAGATFAFTIPARVRSETAHMAGERA